MINKNISRFLGMLGSFFLFIKRNIHTVCFLAGLILLNVTVYFLNIYVGLFVTSAILILIGLLLNPTEPKKGR